MDSSRRVTSIFIAVALLALAALAISVNRQKPVAAEPDMSVLPGLAENLQSMTNITGYPSENFRAVRIMRTNGDEISVTRPDINSGFELQAEPLTDSEKAAYSAILYANAAFLTALGSSADPIVFSDVTPEQQLGQLVYTSFDGLVLENTVFRAGDATWLKITAGYSEKLAEENRNSKGNNLMSADEIKDIIKRLQGRLYKQPDKLPQ